MYHALGVIPARAQSTRFPRKVLAEIAKKPMIQHVWENARSSRLLDRLIVATDDESVSRAVENFGGEARLTPAELNSGTDRTAYVSKGVPSEFVINIQGDEPTLPAQAIDALIEALVNDPEAGMATLGVLKDKVQNAEEWASENVVKVLADGDVAQDFSRQGFRSDSTSFVKHIGIYAFRRPVLNVFCSLSPSPRELAERLEQLRAVENNIRIKLVMVNRDTVAVDTPSDIPKVEAFILALRKEP